jgi:serine/threonine protein phosphatase PrpC
MSTSTGTLTWAGITHTGRVRTQNQDNFYLDPQGRFLILADGMGGHAGGEVASLLTVTAVQRLLESLDWNVLPPAEELAERCISSAVEALSTWVDTHEHQKDLGTTLLIWVRAEQKVILMSLGDSRIYLMRDNQLFQMTLDQVIESELRKRGASRMQAARSPGAAYLSRCVLAKKICTPDVMEVEIRSGDIWLLCSDGLTREVESPEIESILSVCPTEGAEYCVEKLLKRALEQGGRDNVTVIAATFQ